MFPPFNREINYGDIEKIEGNDIERIEGNDINFNRMNITEDKEDTKDTHAEPQTAEPRASAPYADESLLDSQQVESNRSELIEANELFREKYLKPFFEMVELLEEHGMINVLDYDGDYKAVFASLYKELSDTEDCFDILAALGSKRLSARIASAHNFACIAKPLLDKHKENLSIVKDAWSVPVEQLGESVFVAIDALSDDSYDFAEMADIFASVRYEYVLPFDPKYHKLARTSIINNLAVLAGSNDKERVVLGSATIGHFLTYDITYIHKEFRHLPNEEKTANLQNYLVIPATKEFVDFMVRFCEETAKILVSKFTFVWRADCIVAIKQ